MQALQGSAAAHRLDPAAVRDTIAEVFAHPGYDASLRQSLGDRILEWILRAIGSALDALRGSADLRWFIIAVAAILVLLVAARAAYLAGVGARARRTTFRRAGGPAVSPWQAAASAAAAGRYTEAAHLLYAAVLEGIGSRHRIRLHPSRTAGEYQRELNGRAPYAAASFRAFTRRYEPIVWRSRECSEAEFRELLVLAEASLQAAPQRSAA